MEATDFVYDGESLSSFGFVILQEGNRSGLDTIETDSQREFSSVSLFAGKYQPFIYSIYDDRLEIEFSIFKNPCEEDLKITLSEARAIKRWLNRPTPKVFSLVEEEFDGVFWEGSFNVEEIMLGTDRVGFNLTFITNRPFAYGTEVVLDDRVDSANGTFTVTDACDDVGYIYPELHVTCLQSGDLTLTNLFDGRSTVVKNCTAGEEINFSPTLQITTSLSGHNLGVDFNYRFLRINNDYDERENVIVSSLPIDYVLKYKPIIKAVFG